VDARFSPAGSLESVMPIAKLTYSELGKDIVAFIIKDTGFKKTKLKTKLQEIPIGEEELDQIVIEIMGLPFFPNEPKIAFTWDDLDAIMSAGTVEAIVKAFAKKLKIKIPT
jgi:hypothetical protein